MSHRVVFGYSWKALSVLTIFIMIAALSASRSVTTNANANLNPGPEPSIATLDGSPGIPFIKDFSASDPWSSPQVSNQDDLGADCQFFFQCAVTVVVQNKGNAVAKRERVEFSTGISGFWFSGSGWTPLGTGGVGPFSTTGSGPTISVPAREYTQAHIVWYPQAFVVEPPPLQGSSSVKRIPAKPVHGCYQVALFNDKGEPGDKRSRNFRIVFPFGFSSFQTAESAKAVTGKILATSGQQGTKVAQINDPLVIEGLLDRAIDIQLKVNITGSNKGIKILQLRQQPEKSRMQEALRDFYRKLYQAKPEERGKIFDEAATNQLGQSELSEDFSEQLALAKELTDKKGQFRELNLAAPIRLQVGERLWIAVVGELDSGGQINIEGMDLRTREISSVTFINPGE